MIYWSGIKRKVVKLLKIVMAVIIGICPNIAMCNGSGEKLEFLRYKFSDIFASNRENVPEVLKKYCFC